MRGGLADWRRLPSLLWLLPGPGKPVLPLFGGPLTGLFNAGPDSQYTKTAQEIVNICYQTLAEVRGPALNPSNAAFSLAALQMLLFLSPSV